MRVLDRPLIHAAERLVQWAWDAAGVSRIVLLRGAGAAILGASACSSILSTGALGLGPVVLAVALLFLQGRLESQRQRYGDKVNVLIKNLPRRPFPFRGRDSGAGPAGVRASLTFVA